MNFDKPVLFMPNRVWRAYVGGKLMNKYLYGRDAPDGHFPEDWLGSVTVAKNYVNQQFPEEGLARVKNPDGSEGVFFRDLLKKYPRELVGNDAGELGVLCKYLDSAVRLPIQCHPDKEFALNYLDSPNGKTESWFILATRQIDGEEPYLLMGFKENVNADTFKKAVRDQDIAAMKGAMHKISVKAGEVYFVPGRLPHAIGPGVFLLEVQEPTDWIVQPEKHLGDTELSYQEMYGTLRVEDALNCFDYEAGGSLEQIVSRCKLSPKTIVHDEKYTLSEVIGPAITDCFAVYKMILTQSSKVQFNHWAIVVVTEGAAKINHIEVKKGDYFFVPHTADGLNIEVVSGISFYLICSQPLAVV